MASAATVDMAKETRLALAGQALTERQAKLYSQRLRRDMGRDGLVSFAPGDVMGYLEEAMLLLECGWIERGADATSQWRTSVKRAAEILEWLSQASLRPRGAPLYLLAAAAYQIAGFPAMAIGHLRRLPPEEPFSLLLASFLRADFPDVARATQRFWQTQHAFQVAGRRPPADFETEAVRHVVMCIGTICAYVRSGENALVHRAVVKLEHLATSFLHSRDPYSYLLARLTAASAREFIDTCLWPKIDQLRTVSGPRGAEALIQFARSAFINRRALVWPAQAAGIERLRENTSFVLCTPTGSGKTTVATLGAVQGLFAPVEPSSTAAGNLVLYLVPSRALAAEVEGRMAEDLRGIAAEPVVVTGLYGGVDWGPTDAWIQTDQPTAVICTFEKADALLRYLGILFLDRVRAVIVDEAHMVEQDKAKFADLKEGASRAFRLEQLGSRLLRARDQYKFRIIALSAVAAQAAPALARWVTGAPEAVPTSSTYRSTRQMLGRLEVAPNGQFSIRYSLMDGHSLQFDDERRGESPFVRDPFPPLPGGLDAGAGPDVQMRAPTLWAALNLAARRPDGSTPSVMISLTQNIDAFARTCADLMDAWQQYALPDYRTVEGSDVWARCLAAAIDYFTEDSVEYRLLTRGVVVHHGKMPALLARRLKAVIDTGYVRVIIATSTLSEGVNIPVNYLLVPSVYRGNVEFSLQEFSNLVGRAGRPGVATEGSALVVLPERTFENRRGHRVPKYNRQWNGYESLVSKIQDATATAAGATADGDASSPLALLLRALERSWIDLTGGGTPVDFARWLEETAVVPLVDGTVPDALEYLGSLDAFLIAAIEEVEELQDSELDGADLEAELIGIWRRTYAFASGQAEAALATTWLARGRVIKRHYPDALERRRLYKTSLPPMAGKLLLDRIENVRARLNEGREYTRFSVDQKLAFIQGVLAVLSEIPTFRIRRELGRRRTFNDWPRLLRWWLAKSSLDRQPRPSDVTNWFSFVAQNFIYRGAWGLGSVVGLLMDAPIDGRPIRALEIEDWPRTGLPWIAFWLKELINWGTLDPVAAFLLAKGDAVDRPQAERDASAYYAGKELMNANDVLDPRLIRDWVDARSDRSAPRSVAQRMGLPVQLARPAESFRQERITVTPLSDSDQIIWLDPAGYEVARSSALPEPFDDSKFQFELVVPISFITGEPYLPHR
ncbi:hypothetical protein ABIB83_007956 [Bradyrhizobium sp. I1.8.5]|uniref:DEAD/DEAH box helicase n=1 Tax=Bradyrhizobium sp. I1.8.5 TaxID=3156365 RepID=UPI0033953CA5